MRGRVHGGSADTTEESTRANAIELRILKPRALCSTVANGPRWLKAALLLGTLMVRVEDEDVHDDYDDDDDTDNDDDTHDDDYDDDDDDDDNDDDANDDDNR